MGKMRNLSIEERAKVVVLVEEGYSMNKVAQTAGVSRYCVQMILKKQNETGIVAYRYRSGHPRLLQLGNTVNLYE